MRFRPLPIMTVCVVISLAILAMLGNWQWQRFSEKSEAVTTEVIWEPLYATAVDEQVFFVSTIINGRSAWKHVGVFEDSGREDIVLATFFISFQINVPEVTTLARGREFDFEDGVFLTPAAPSWITNPPGEHSFFAYDVEGMRARLPEVLAGRLRSEIYEPRLIGVRDDVGDLGEILNPSADPVVADPLPPARHLGYALTWWGMAIALLIMYFGYHVSVGRLSFGKTP